MGTEQFPVPIQLLSKSWTGNWNPAVPINNSLAPSFPCDFVFGLQIPQNIRRASRAGWLKSTMFLCCWAPNTPKFSRRASRAGSLDPLMFLCFHAQNTPKFPRRASRAGWLKFLCFCAFGLHIPPKKNPARFARRMA